jgi:actin-related protein
MSDFSTVVIDLGAGFVKAGLAGAEGPTVVFPRAAGDGAPRDGWESHGWEDAEAVLDRVFSRELGVDPERCRVLVVEPVGMSTAPRENMTRVLFERFGVAGFYTKSAAVLTLYGTGRIDGIVVDAGERSSSVVPVSQGFVLPRSIQRLGLGGWGLTSAMMKLLAEAGSPFSSPADRDLVRGIKEASCYVATDFAAELAASGGGAATQPFTLPSGQVLTLGSERFRCPEALFQPNLAEVDAPGLSRMVVDAISGCDRFLRRTLAGAIVLTGGSTRFEGLAARLQAEVNAQLPSMEVQVRTPAERHTAWLGGSLLASLSSFEQMWMSASDYAESGASLVTRACIN